MPTDPRDPRSGPGRSALRKPNEVDAHVGGRLRLRRTLLGISQEELAGRLGLAFQQVQKYENGSNRVSASRLFQLATVLDVPIAWFFEGLDALGASAEAAIGGCRSTDQRAALDLVRIYARIGDGRLRRQLYEIAKAFADAPPSAPHHG